MNSWIVITGGPSSGKTTTINLLKKKGFKVNEERARIYYEQEISKGRSVDEIKSYPAQKQEGILGLHLELEKNLDPDETNFLDRAIPDMKAYYKLDKLEIPDSYEKAYKDCFYSTVFFLERLPMINDEIRTETDEEAENLANDIYSSYSDLKLDIKKIPVMKPEERVNFIISSLKI